jgi:hypothetical protein
MLGLGDFSVFAAYVLCILSTILCVVYGVVNWNKGGDVSPEEAAEEARWEAEERKIDSELSGSGGEL